MLFNYTFSDRTSYPRTTKNYSEVSESRVFAKLSIVIWLTVYAQKIITSVMNKPAQLRVPLSNPSCSMSLFQMHQDLMFISSGSVNRYGTLCLFQCPPLHTASEMLSDVVALFDRLKRTENSLSSHGSAFWSVNIFSLLFNYLHQSTHISCAHVSIWPR